MKFRTNILENFIVEIFQAAGCCHEEASLIAANLVDASLCGHDSHGVIRVARYVGFLREGTAKANQTVEIMFDGGSLLSLNGKMGFGQSVGMQAMDLLNKRAKQYGIALVSLQSCGHLGRLGAWAEMLAKEGLVSLHFLNTTGVANMVTPYGAKERRLSPSVFTIGVPHKNDTHPVILDMTTAATAEGKLLVAKNAGKSVPPGIIIDKEGNATTDPNDFYDGGAILPMGEHKGSGLNIVTDILAGAISGGSCTAPGVTILDNNMTSIAIDIEKFSHSSQIHEQIDRFYAWVKSAEPREGHDEVLMPGDRGWGIRTNQLRDGIPIDETTWGEITAVAESVGVNKTLFPDSIDCLN